MILLPATVTASGAANITWHSVSFFANDALLCRSGRETRAEADKELEKMEDGRREGGEDIRIMS